MLDHGGDAAAVLVRLDELHGNHGWTLLALLDVALERARAEAAIRPSFLTSEAVRHLTSAADDERRRRGGLAPAGALELVPDPEQPAWPWLSADVAGQGTLTFAPSITGGEVEGITLELLLVLAQQLAIDAGRALPGQASLAVVELRLSRALQAVATRDRLLRARRRNGSP